MVARPADLAAPRPDLDALDQLARRVRPTTLAGDRVLPVLPALEALLPGAGLRRGSSLAVAPGLAGRSLALAMVAGASAAGSWAAAVGVAGSVGLLAGHELGIDLNRFPQVAEPPAAQWAEVVAALLDGVDVVVVGPSRVRPADARRLTARARERGAVLVRLGGRWPEGADVELRVIRAEWEGLGSGHGHLRGRRVEVEVGGRRSAGSGSRHWLWLPHPSGGVQPAEPPGEMARVHHLGERSRPRARVRRPAR